MIIHHPFYQQILHFLIDYQVRYLLVGGYAVNYYGYSRGTLDMDLWVDSEAKNVEKLYSVFTALNYSDEDAKTAVSEIKSGRNIHVIEQDAKVDVIQLYSTYLSFDLAFGRKTRLPFKNTEIYVIDFDDLVDTKIRAGRQKDLLDVQQLKEIRAFELKKKT